MAEKSLSYFMRETAKKTEIVEIPGVESIVDDDGNVVPFKVRLLNKKEIGDIYKKYRTRTLMYDERRNPLIVRGQPIFDVQTDTDKALRRILVDALVYPDLRDKELMEYYECYDVTEMPVKLFPNTKEYDHVEKSVLAALGILEEDSKDEVQEAKN